MSSSNNIEQSELKECFDLFDKNGDGKISQEELYDALKSLGQNPTDQEVETLMASCDTDRDGTIDFVEFHTLMTNQLLTDHPSHEAEMKEAFKVFDKNGDGLISEQELNEVMLSLGEKLTGEELKMMIKAADRDGNGMIDYMEFISLMNNKK